MELQLGSDGGRLRAILTNPPAGSTTRRGLVICHSVPLGRDAQTPPVDTSFGELADALAGATDWTVLTFDFRASTSASPREWLVDLRTAVDHLVELDGISGVWLAGFSVGGALAICLAGEDERIRGVAALAAPAELDDWVADRAGVMPLQSVSKIPPRPLLLVHGDADDLVPVTESRALADAAGGEVELRILAGAAHGLRHDPRATAVLEGWLDRQAD